MRRATTIILAGAIGMCFMADADACDKKGNRDGSRRDEIIKKFDKDGDGQLSEQERADAREAFKAKMAERKAELIKKYDKDGDGKLSEEERKAARDNHGKNCGKRRKGNNGLGNGRDPQPPGNPPVNDGPGTGPGTPGVLTI